ncbi:hypothetical protein TNIN_401621 [Trichonephila inaurata madagascariensis]|uniref:Uncharacterized protein n=1 Tax=Trichonephila inaurata madagascariensis TaxID=2747483 RepID=A0A8X7CU47_9ARAC|nr:hypothetical protein TNIN_477991 [Trichonephila inaurata madagascariensis]GFY77602.1 hypothetical protein TNIN_401621 [Trichonephila inaurata madagascariensis]
MNNQRYQNEILGQLERPYAAAGEEDFITIDNNTCQHRTLFVGRDLIDQGVRPMNCSICSPDLNLGRVIAALNPLPENCLNIHLYARQFKLLIGKPILIPR